MHPGPQRTAGRHDRRLRGGSRDGRRGVRRAVDAVARARSGDDADQDAALQALAGARAVLADDASHRRTRPVALELADELDRLDGAGRDLPSRRTIRDDLRASWHRPGWRLDGVRIAVASLAAGVLAQVAGFGHPVWAQMGATATLQGTRAHHATIRALQRGAGTALGALLAWPLLAADLGFGATCAVVVTLQVVTEIVVGRHYGLAMLTITPMALLMTTLAAPSDPAGIVSARAIDTILGAVLGVLAVVLVHPRTRRAGGAHDAEGAAAS